MLLAAVTTVAAVYVYFLIFAQFGFLKAVNAAWEDAGGVVDSILAGMGLAGIAGSVIAARIFSPARGQRLMATGWILCALAAAGAPFARSIATFSGAALLTGLGVGLVTVTLAGLLQPAIGHKHLGLLIGTGTGFAYGFCNLPGVFDASATAQAAIATITALVGLIASRGLTARTNAEPPVGDDYSGRGIGLWVGIFFVLVCLDSAMFFLIQHSAGLKQSLWDGSGRQLGNAGMHLVAGVIAGWALDRRGPGLVVVVSATALVLTAWVLSGGRMSTPSALVYIAAVSAYSTALVFYPARGGRPGVAAWVYAVAGWIGSALGIGLAQARGQLSPAAIALAGTLLAISLMGRYFASRRGRAMNENYGS